MEMDEDVDLKIVVDGKEIAVKEFVQNIIGRAIVSSVCVLKGVNEDWEEMELTVRKAAK
ncbi:MAG: hypothetical protein U9O85_01475 [Euryarchaeota archaeon]|jgi:hypothetical protein|nr:hypothetical protein [Euryarchaeota archaeon]